MQVWEGDGIANKRLVATVSNVAALDVLEGVVLGLRKRYGLQQPALRIAGLRE